MIEWLIIVLALSGFIISCYFTFAYYGWVKNARWVPAVLCAREGSSCVTVLQAPYARLFGVPNSLVGMFYYLVILSLFAAAFILRDYVHHPVTSLLAGTAYLGSIFAVLTGAHLIYALRWKLRINCPLCYAAHAINLAIFVLLFFPNW